MYRLRDAAENFSRTGRGDGAAVIGALRLVDDDENKIARVVRGEVPHEGRDVLARSDVPVLVLLRGARLARDAQPFDIRLLAAALSDDAFEHGGKELRSLLAHRAAEKALPGFEVHGAVLRRDAFNKAGRVVISPVDCRRGGARELQGRHRDALPESDARKVAVF